MFKVQIIMKIKQRLTITPNFVSGGIVDKGEETITTK